MAFKAGDEVQIHSGGYSGLCGRILNSKAMPDGESVNHVEFEYEGESRYGIYYGHELIPINQNKETTGMAEIKDSGERTEFTSGAVRDMHEEKGDMLSLPAMALLRLSLHYENGAKKYGRFNYLRGIPLSSFIDSAMRHLVKYIAGWDDEDHLAACAFNILGALQMEEENPGMCDIEWRKGLKQFHYPREEDKSSDKES